MKFDYIFVVLVYKNISVLRDFFFSLNAKNYKVIVVNSYYDDITEKECSLVANENNADFIPIPNKGFGYGNNIGAKFAIEYYEFKYLILSNSDIKIESFSFLETTVLKNAVIAPFTHLPNGKIQNPNIPYKIDILYKLLYFAYDHPSKLLLVIAHVLTRLSRELFLLKTRFIKRDIYRIFSCHGSFIIFTSDVVEKLFPFFDDKMFLYNEESYLAFKCLKHNVNVLYCPKIKIEHLEGASTIAMTKSNFRYNKESYDILYSHINNNDF